ncbi:helix-turn-helix domain-containing protein [Geomicrobium sp. JCM 19039]|uniref:helix-turn-helix domain-containing protein n=1 Tax=Geomicrobium sp. JCM 19039 TaxID=1460636 RepID=UPI00045F379D|nr:helix-turn-helix domain-containing protein [Geomicrobium sp. JCM 19039]GAK14090.1 transcriptional regulator, AraC family [Geomicrobium sp. JCM 19039]
MSKTTFLQMVNAYTFHFVTAVHLKKGQVSNEDGFYITIDRDTCSVTTVDQLGSRSAHYVLVCEAYDKDKHNASMLKVPLEKISLTFQKNEQFVHKIQQLIALAHMKEVHGYRPTYTFYEILYIIYGEINDGNDDTLSKRLDGVKQYIDQYFSTSLTRTQLAQKAGLNRDYFSRVFKERYAQSPISYLNHVRLTHAKRLLVQNRATIREVALKVGYNDEFYFSRQFKQLTGYSPNHYMKTRDRTTKVASLHHLVTGHLLALDCFPYAAIMNDSYPISLKEAGVLDIGRERADVNKILDAQPDVIIQKASIMQESGNRLDVMNNIAPVVNLPYTSTWRDHFQQVADIVHRQEHAKQWLKQYDEKAKTIRDRIKLQIGEGTVVVIGVGEQGYCIYGMRNMGTVLYDDLHIQAPKEVERIAHLRPVGLEDVLRMDADYIILTLYRSHDRLPDQNAIERQLRTLKETKQWQLLKAVQNDRIFALYDTKHLYTSYNAYSHNLFLNKLVEFFVT